MSKTTNGVAAASAAAEQQEDNELATGRAMGDALDLSEVGSRFASSGRFHFLDTTSLGKAIFFWCGGRRCHIEGVDGRRQQQQPQVRVGLVRGEGGGAASE